MRDSPPPKGASESVDTPLRRQHAEIIRLLLHDLRSPLTALKTGHALITEEPDPALVHEVSASCAQAVTNLEIMLEDIAVTMGDTLHPDTLRHQACNVRAPLATAAADLATLASMRQVAVQIDVPPGTSVLADPGVLAALFRSLLGFAIEGSPAKSSVRVSAKASGDDLVLTIADAGLPPPVTNPELLFEPAAVPGLKSQGIRTGRALALAAARRRALALGGALDVAAGEHGGQITMIRLPNAPA